MSEKPFSNEVEKQWCPGCPNHGILKAVQQALAALELKPGEVCLVSGIGQAAKLPHYVEANLFNGLHGRAVPVATGIKAANPKLTVLVTSGDGDLYGEGGNHLLHALRRNPDLTIVAHDNEIYALTKGQASPTTPLGEVRSLQMAGVDETPLNPLALAIVQGCGFVARGFAADPEPLAELIAQGIAHKGLSLIEVVQPCITWVDHPVAWYRERLRPLGEDHDPEDPLAALARARETDPLATGILYRQKKTIRGFDERRIKVLGERPAFALAQNEGRNLAGFLERFRA